MQPRLSPWGPGEAAHRTRRVSWLTSVSFQKQRDTEISSKGSKPAMCPAAATETGRSGWEQGDQGDQVPGLQPSLGHTRRNQAGEHRALGTGQSHPESTQRARVLKMSGRVE